MTRSIGDLTYEELLEIEEQSNQVEILGMPLGSAIGKAIQYDLSKQTEGTFTDVLKTRFNIWRLNKGRSSNLWKPQTQVATTKPFVFCLTNSNHRIWSFFEPLLAILTSHSVLLTGKSRGQLDHPFLDLRYLDPKYFPIWKTHRAAFMVSITKLLHKLQHQFNLNPWSCLTLKQLMLIQAQRLIGSYGLLQDLKPPLVITDHDRQNLNSCLILAANELSIPTYTFIHGSTYPPKAYLPFLAQYVFCWGQNHIQQFSRSGVDPERLLLVGNTKITKITAVDKATEARKLELPAQQKVCLLATNNIEDHHRWKLAHNFCKAFKQETHWQGVVRLHPLESIADYQHLIEEYPHVKFVANDKWSTAQALGAASAIIVHNSVFGLEALLQNVAVGVLDVLDLTLGIGEDLIEKAGCPRLMDPGGLSQWLNHINDPAGYHQQIGASRSFVSGHCSAIGVEAAQNIFTYLKQHNSSL